MDWQSEIDQIQASLSIVSTRLEQLVSGIQRLETDKIRMSQALTDQDRQIAKLQQAVEPEFNGDVV